MTDPADGFIPLEFGVHKSLRYHSKRRAFFEVFHRSTMAIAAIGGSAAFVALLGDSTGLAKWFTSVMAIATALDVAVGYSERARRHDGLYRRYADLAAGIALMEKPSSAKVREWKNYRLMIEKDEPTSIAALNIECHNEEAEARGYDDDQIYQIRWYQAAMSHFGTLPPHDFKPRATQGEQYRKEAGG